MQRRTLILGGGALATLAGTPWRVWAGAQKYEPLVASVRAGLHEAVSDQAAPYLVFPEVAQGHAWFGTMSQRLERRIPNPVERQDFLVSTQYESKRAGLDTQLVLGLIQVESNFRKYAVSRAGARGFMQVMPFWTGLAERPRDNLFHLRTNLRYGCWILRHYLDAENGNLFRALGRYNGSTGEAEYPNLVLRAWNSNWKYPATATGAGPGSETAVSAAR
jgi:soluble lytic murein transglycosylase-like protein